MLSTVPKQREKPKIALKDAISVQQRTCLTQQNKSSNSQVLCRVPTSAQAAVTSWHWLPALLTGCLLCSCLHILLLKNCPLPSQCGKGLVTMMTKLATLTFSSKAVRVGSSCSLEKQGVTSYFMGKEGCRGLQGVEAWGTPQAPEEIQLVHFMPFLQLSSMRLTQKKHQPNLHHATGAAVGNQVLDIAENCGYKAPLQYTYDQQL